MQKHRSANTDKNSLQRSRFYAYQFALSLGLISPRCQCVSGHVVRASLSYRGSLRKQKFVSGVKTQGLKSICGERVVFFRSDFSVSICSMVELRMTERRNSVPADDLLLPRLACDQALCLGKK